MRLGFDECSVIVYRKCHNATVILGSAHIKQETWLPRVCVTVAQS